MHQINDVIVQDGTVVLKHLPYADGEHVRIVVAREDEPGPKRLSITEVRAALGKSVTHLDDPVTPMIPVDDWEMLK